MKCYGVTYEVQATDGTEYPYARMWIQQNKAGLWEFYNDWDSRREVYRTEDEARNAMKQAHELMKTELLG